MMPKLHHSHAGLLVVRENKQMMIALNKPVTVIGRKQADILLEDVKASARHAEIRMEGSQIILVDLDSTNGTFVNRSPVTRIALSDQDVIEIGSTTLCYFEDSRQYNGDAQQKKSATHKMRNPQAETSHSGATSVTTTQTLQQITVQLKVTEGPNAGKVYRFKKSHITIGRNDADVVLLDPDVSRAHVLVEVFGKNAVFVRDLGSTNGTYLKGTKVQSEKLTSGDDLVVGNSKIEISFDGNAE